MSRRSGGGKSILEPGVLSTWEQAIRFTDWHDARRYPPTYRDVMDRFDIHRSTAYRWLASLRRARGAADDVQPTSEDLS